MWADGRDRKGIDLNVFADNILTFLHSQGVVIKVKCPDCVWSQFKTDESVGMTPCYHCNSTGYIFEPLIEVKDEEGA